MSRSFGETAASFSRSSDRGPRTRKRHGFVMWWFGAQRARSNSARSVSSLMPDKSGDCAAALYSISASAPASSREISCAFARLVFAPGSGGSVSAFDVITSQPKDWLFNAGKTLYYAQRENWSVIPEAQRNTRAELRAAADAYLNLFKDKTVQVPWGTPCARLEGILLRDEDWVPSVNQWDTETLQLAKRPRTRKSLAELLA